MPETRFLEVEAAEAGQRLDVFLTRRLEETSRTAVQRWIESGKVTVNEATERAKYSVRPGDRIRVEIPPPEPVELIPEPIPIQIVYEDDLLVVVDKRAGMVVHPGAGNRSGTLAHALLYHFQEISRQETIRPGIVHRLDKDTSGLLVVAKNDRVHHFLARQFKSRKVEKHYLALVYGRVERRKGTIDVAIGRDPWLRTKVSPRSRVARPALTQYELIRTVGEQFSYLRVILHTGRTHQIRVHFQHIGHPVVGDETYGARPKQAIKDTAKLQAIEDLGRHFLHAAFLSFVHPATKERVTFESPLPSELAKLLALLE